MIIALETSSNGVFPAHAGMDRWSRTRPHGGLLCSPHTRGWTGGRHSSSAPGRRVPRTRGDGPRYFGGVCVVGDVFPAHAGMDRPAHASPCGGRWCSPHTRGWTASLDRLLSLLDRVPRTRGDGPSPLSRQAARRACSPHTRGWTGDRHLAIRIVGKCSPHTRGWTATRQVGHVTVRRVPRTRGDGPAGGSTALGGSWGVPRTRGDGPVSPGNRPESKDVFPAHAGMDRSVAARGRPGLWCSPHTRGWTDAKLAELQAQLVFPAHAGMDRARQLRGRGDVGVPRTRGDGPQFVSGDPNSEIVFPAHAGMDRPPLPAT